MPKKYQYTKRGKTMNYEQTALEKAVASVQNGLSVRQAAEKFHVPRSTIGDRVSGKLSVTSTHGRPPALPTEVETKIVGSIKMAAKLGVGLSRKQILRRTNVLCTRMKISTNYSQFHAGKDWFEGLKRRYPELTLRKPEKLSSVRARMLNPEVLAKYFDALGTIIEEGNFEPSPHKIWNTDETGFNMEHNLVRVYADKGERSVVSKTNTRSSNVTVMACVNAVGTRMPPMFITKGKTTRSLHGYRTEDAPETSVWTYQKNGWISDEIGEQWFNQVFLKNCGPERPQLLLMDGHGSHETLAIIERAIEENIVLMVFPPHCTHFLQPLDRTVFGPLKTAYNTACSDFLQQSPLNQVNKYTFPSLFNQAWSAALSVVNIQNGFRACGVVPLNRRAVPSKAYNPSKLTDCPERTALPAAGNTDLPTVENLNVAQETADANVVESNSDALDISVAFSEDAEVSISDINLSYQSIAADFLPENNFEQSNHVLDLSDPQQILSLLASGDAVMEDPGNQSDFINQVSIDSCVDSLFLPEKLNERPSGKPKPSRSVCTSHKILTSSEIVEQKRLMLEKKTRKTSKGKGRKIKTEG